MPGPAGDAEVLVMLFQFLGRLGLTELRARINCVPTGAARVAFAEALRNHLAPHADALGTEDRRRLDQNPLRLFDSKNPRVQALLAGAPRTIDFLDERARAHHEELKGLLAQARIDFEEDPRLVRGLDYYTLTVFEVVSARLGAQDAILGGGRYDDLFGELGGPPTAAVGFAIGEDRLVTATTEDPRPALPVVFVIPDSTANSSRRSRCPARSAGCLPEAVVETDLTGARPGAGDLPGGRSCWPAPPTSPSGPTASVSFSWERRKQRAARSR